MSLLKNQFTSERSVTARGSPVNHDPRPSPRPAVHPLRRKERGHVRSHQGSLQCRDDRPCRPRQDHAHCRHHQGAAPCEKTVRSPPLLECLERGLALSRRTDTARLYRVDVHSPLPPPRPHAPLVGGSDVRNRVIRNRVSSHQRTHHYRTPFTLFDRLASPHIHLPPPSPLRSSRSRAVRSTPRTRTLTKRRRRRRVALPSRRRTSSMRRRTATTPTSTAPGTMTTSRT